ncbi:hypothetical protein ACVGXB_00095, partial [Enterobacter intestinihominis]
PLRQDWPAGRRWCLANGVVAGGGCVNRPSVRRWFIPGYAHPTTREKKQHNNNINFILEYFIHIFPLLTYKKIIKNPKIFKTTNNKDQNH